MRTIVDLRQSSAEEPGSLLGVNSLPLRTEDVLPRYASFSTSESVLASVDLENPALRGRIPCNAHPQNPFRLLKALSAARYDRKAEPFRSLRFGSCPDPTSNPFTTKGL